MRERERERERERKRERERWREEEVGEACLIAKRTDIYIANV